MRDLLRGRWPLIVLAIVILLVLSANRIALFVTDWWWFSAVGAGEVFTGILGARIVLGLLAMVVLGGLIAVNLQVARRLRPLVVPQTPQQAIIETYRAKVDPYLKWLIAAVALVFGVSSGFAAATQWEPFLLWQNAQSFGLEDPEFGRDVGFFVFQLPFLRFVQGWLFTSLVLVTLLTAGAHLLLGGIRPDAPRDKVLPTVKAHLSVLLALLLAARGWGYWLDRYQLNFSPRGTVTGASYTDVNAELPALYLLLAVTAVAIGLLLFNIRRRGFLLPGAAIGLLIVASILLQGVYPALVQRFSVDPQELTREADYIDRNRQFTQIGYGLDGIDLPTFTVGDNLTPADVEENEVTFANVRLWDPSLLQDNYEQLQALRPYYQFNDVDIDRYTIDGELRQVMLSARELDNEGISDQWQNERLTFTHGYGIVASQVNRATSEGQPVFLARDIPPRTNEAVAPDGELVPEDEPGMYYGDRGYPEYSIVNTDQQEIDYEEPDTQEQVTTSYAGEGGVTLGNRLRRLAFALRFSDPNFVLSGLLRNDSQVIYHRTVRDRVSMVAPYLTLDSDPYPVVLGGRVLWVQDAYTTSREFPYSQRTNLATADLTEVNYVRNSVKAVVDAYDGTVTLYRVDPEDPLAKAWSEAFPGQWAELDEAPEGLAEHFRYPVDLFRLQARLYTRYHIPDTAAFYNNADAWEIPRDAALLENNPNLAEGQAPMEPYYLLMRLPGQETEEFVLIQPYVPSGKENMIAWLAARSDPANYGELFAVQFPTDSQVLGPRQAHGRIEQEAELAREITLVDQAGSELIRGNLLVLPVEESIVFVEPLFLQNPQSRIPELWNVVLVMGDRVVMRPTLDEALEALVTGGEPVDPDEQVAQPGDPIPGEEPTDVPTDQPTGPDATDSPDPTDPPIDGDDPTALILEALAAFEEADEALADGDLGEYQRLVRRAQDLLEQAAELQGVEASPSPTPGTSPPPSPEATATGTDTDVEAAASTG